MGRAVFTVIAAFVVGFLIGSFFLSGFRPLMLRLAWLPGGAMTLGVVCGLVFASIAVGKERRRLVRQRELHLYASRSSLRFSPKGSESIADEIKRLTGYSGRWWLENEMQGRVDAIRMTVGDLYHCSTGENSKTTVRTVAHFRGGDLYFPHFTLQREGKLVTFVGDLAGVRDIDFSSHPEFSRLYHLSSDQPETTQQLFTDECLQYFAADHGWQIRAERDQMMMTRDEVIAAGDLDLFIDQTQAILALLRCAMQQLLESPNPPNMGPTVAGNRSQRGARSSRAIQTDQASSRRGFTEESDVNHAPKGWLARRVSANTIRWGEVQAFVQLPVPRTVPAAIQRQRAGCNGLILIGFLSLVGLMVAPLFVLSVIRINEVPLSFLILISMIILAVTAGLSWLLNKRKRNVQILRQGRLTSAEIVGVRATGWEVNSQPQFEVEFRYTADGQTRLKKLKVYGGHGDLAHAVLDSREETPLLVDPHDADHCVLGIQLTNSVRIRL